MPSNADDVRFMALVAAGDSEAQRALVRRLLRRIQRLCRALLRNQHDAEDAAQLSVLEVLKSARNYRGESSLERWTDRITVRTTLRAAASERRAHGAPLEGEVGVTHGNIEHSLLAGECLDRLSERQRSVLILRHGLEYSIEEIAELFGISPNTVKDRLLRGRSALRRELQRGEPAPAHRLRLAGDE
ncbi:MAG: RNA polymerase sigma factor [Myxococcota bacterium]|nr:RNA polymerase sigma factor [Myxococcota bacterium]